MERATKKTDKKEGVKKVETVKTEVTMEIDEEKLKAIVEKTTKKEAVIKPHVVVETITETGEEREILLKNTGGSFHMGRRRIIKPGENFKAKWSDIPTGFRDTIYPLEAIPAKASVPLLPGKKEEFELIAKGETEEDGYDVLNKDTGKKINGKPLPKVTAEKLIEDLSR